MSRAVAGVDRTTAAPPADRCQDGEEDPLHRRRGLGQLRAGIAELAVRDGDLQGARNPLAIRPAVARETEERLEEGLRVERRPKLDPHRRLPFAAVPPPVGSSSWNRRLVPDVKVASLTLDLECDPTGGAPEALLLAQMAVRRCNRSPRAKVEVCRQQLATRACRRLDPDDPLAADRVLDRLTDLRHATTLPAGQPGHQTACALAKR